MNRDSKIAPVWQLPVAGSERTGNAYIHPKAKYHCFKNSLSLCEKYSQRTSDYDEGISIDDFEVTNRSLRGSTNILCKRCYRLWLKRRD